MSLPVPDIINLNYPMFDLTKRERKLLELIEPRIIDKMNSGDWEGLCYYLYNNRLTEKVGRSLGEYAYLHSRLRNQSIELDTYMDKCSVKENSDIRNYLRLVWITKLLNQDILKCL